MITMITSILQSVVAEPSIAPIYEVVKGVFDSYKFAIMIALAVLCFIVGFFGRRLSGVIRVVLVFAVGFIASVHWLLPLIGKQLPDAVPGYAIGLAVGLFAAVISRFIYDAVFVGVIAFDVYNILFNALYVKELTTYTQGNLGLCIGITFAVVLIALLSRKYLEMIVTAAGGGIGVAFFVGQVFNYSALMGMESLTAMLVVGGVLAVPMFAYQYYNRVIY